MSFIYKDKEFKKFLEKFAQSTVDSVKSVSAPTVTPTKTILPGDDAKIAYEIAPSLLASLQRIVDPTSAPKQEIPISSESGAAVELKPENLRSLGDFITWLSTHKITWNGKRVAWMGGGEKPPDSALKFSVWEGSRAREDSGEVKTLDAYADKVSLLALLSALRDSQEAQDNTVLKVMIGSTIEQVNESLGEKLPTRGTKKEETLSNPDQTVDGFPDFILDPRTSLSISGHPSFAGFNVKLTKKDIATQPAFLSWLRKMKVRVIEGDNKGATVSALDADPCTAVYILYKRAFALSSVAEADEELSPGYKKIVDMYLANIQAFGKMLQKDGQYCAVITPTTVNPTEKDTKEKAKETTQSKEQSIGLAGADILRRMADEMPFSNRDINFDRIRTYFKTLESLLGPAISSVKPNIDEAEKAMVAAESYFKIPQTIFGPMGWSDFAGLLKDVTKYQEALLWMKSVVEQTRNVLEKLYSAYFRFFSEDKELIGKFQQQIGRTSSDASYYSDSASAVRRLLNDQSRVLKVK